MGRPPSIIEDYREWERRLERYQTHEVNLDVFCLQEGVSRSTFYRKRRLDKGIPEMLQADAAEPELNGSTDALFLPMGAAHPEAILSHRLHESRTKAIRTLARRAHRRARTC